jgi:hypothetical protein
VLTYVEAALGGELARPTTWTTQIKGKNRPILNDALGSEFGAMLYDACINPDHDEGSRVRLHGLRRTRYPSEVVPGRRRTLTLGRAGYQRQYELILSGSKKGTDDFWCGARDEGDVWFVDKPSKNDLHPTIKPIQLVERAIRNSSKSRDIARAQADVLDWSSSIRSMSM